MTATGDTLYLAGPMRGYDQFNFPAFQDAAVRLRRAGWIILSPAERDIAEGFDPTLNSLDGFDVEAAMAADFGMILKADGIVLLPGWEKSKGARAERFVAEQVGKRVFQLDRPRRGMQNADPWNGNPHLPAEDAGWDVGEKANDESGWLVVTPTTETRITNPDTGGEKGSKLQRYDLIPAGPLATLAEHYGRGATKYVDRNWERGYSWSLSFAALNRHLWAFWNREDLDAETGSPHMAAVAWHAFLLMEFANTHPELDDRP